MVSVSSHGHVPRRKNGHFHYVRMLDNTDTNEARLFLDVLLVWALGQDIWLIGLSQLVL